MRALKTWLVGFAPLCVGCAPIIAHGPDVHTGFSGGVSAALGMGPRYDDGDDPGPFYSGAVALGAAYGIRPASDARPAIRFGVQGPTAGGVAVDVFAQAPRRWLGPVSAGLGLLAETSDGRQIPYAQAGLVNGAGLGGNVAIARYRNRTTHIGYTSTESAVVNWLNIQAPLNGFATLHLHAGYAAGHVTKSLERSSQPSVDEYRWAMLGGATLQIHRPGATPRHDSTR